MWGIVGFSKCEWEKKRESMKSEGTILEGTMCEISLNVWKFSKRIYWRMLTLISLNVKMHTIPGIVLCVTSLLWLIECESSLPMVTSKEYLVGVVLWDATWKSHKYDLEFS